MDDLVQYALEQIAFDGTRGTPLPRLWSAIADFHTSRGLVQTVDQPYQEYLWSLLIRCEEFFVCSRVSNSGAEGVKVQTISEPLISDLLSLEAAHGQSIVIRASEERQWMTLARHSVDHKKIPPLTFACLSSISAARVKGITSIDLCRDTGQDKRSVPARCKRLVERGYV